MEREIERTKGKVKNHNVKARGRRDEKGRRERERDEAIGGEQ